MRIIPLFHPAPLVFPRLDKAAGLPIVKRVFTESFYPIKHFPGSHFTTLGLIIKRKIEKNRGKLRPNLSLSLSKSVNFCLSVNISQSFSFVKRNLSKNVLGCGSAG